jgi:hypothetical protein
MPYTDKTAVQNYSLTNIDGAFDVQLTAWITAMSRFMDQYTGRTLVQDTATTRMYDGNVDAELKIDDVNAITEVTVDDVVITPYTYPANSARKYLLRLQDDYFPIGMQNVAVTGKFGYFTALPEDIKFACTVLVVGIVNQSNKQTDGIASEKVGEYQVSYRTEKERADYSRAMQILDGYKVISF